MVGLVQPGVAGLGQRQAGLRHLGFLQLQAPADPAHPGAVGPPAGAVHLGVGAVRVP